MFPKQITCPFCLNTYELDYYQLPNSIQPCCDKALLRKQIYQKKFELSVFNQEFYVHVEEYPDYQDIHPETTVAFPLVDALFEGLVCPVSGHVEDTTTVYTYYRDPSTITHDSSTCHQAIMPSFLKISIRRKVNYSLSTSD
jgi:hypothetical protein